MLDTGNQLSLPRPFRTKPPGPPHSETLLRERLKCALIGRLREPTSNELAMGNALVNEWELEMIMWTGTGDDSG